MTFNHRRNTKKHLHIWKGIGDNMKPLKGETYNNDRLKKEIGELIDKHGAYSFEIVKTVEVGETVKVRVILDLLYNEECGTLV